MDFIDWCHHVLAVLEKEKFNQDLDDYGISDVIFSKEISQQPSFHESNVRMGMFDTLELLEEAGLLEKNTWNWKITPFGRKVLANPTHYWTEICNEELDSEEAILLKLVNKLSPQISTEPLYGWLKEATQDDFPPLFDVDLSAARTNEQMDMWQKYIYDLPALLEQRHFLQVDAMVGYHTELKSTYQGLVWDLKRGFTVESQLIDELIKEWETTNVDFKRELNLDTKKQKAEFAKDVLGLATTKSSGRRYLIIGFDDKTRGYHNPPDKTLTQNRIEKILGDLTDPVVNVRYDVIDYRLGKVGKLEVIREPEKLPYRAAKDVFIDDKQNKGLEKGKIYVRHGSQTEPPTETELRALENEGQRAREESN